LRKPPTIVVCKQLHVCRGNEPFFFPGGSHFEFSSEKNWGVEQDDCRIFDSIDIPHLADSIASVPFHLRHNIPVELFNVYLLQI